jgi:CheY-like chemotaxis protein
MIPLLNPTETNPQPRSSNGSAEAIHRLELADQRLLGEDFCQIAKRVATRYDPRPMSNASRPRMLVIDDDANVREVLEHLLASFGYECQTAADATSGLARFDEGDWDLLLVDIVMPGMSGWAMIESIRRRAPTVPVVLITGLTQPAVMQRARTWRLPVIAKPFRADAFRAVVVNALQTTLS